MVLKISFVAAIAGAGTGPDQQWLANLRAINKINGPFPWVPGSHPQNDSIGAIRGGQFAPANRQQASDGLVKIVT